jgi:hypothetical protein
MGQSYEPHRIFFQIQSIIFFSSIYIWPYPRQNPMRWPRRQPGRQAHGGTSVSSAPCAVPMRLSRIDQHINDEPCAKRRALLDVSSNRYSSVSRGVQSAVPIFIGSPLVTTGGRRCVYMYSVLVLQCTAVQRACVRLCTQPY